MESFTDKLSDKLNLFKQKNLYIVVKKSDGQFLCHTKGSRPRKFFSSTDLANISLYKAMGTASNIAIKRYKDCEAKEIEFSMRVL